MHRQQRRFLSALLVAALLLTAAGCGNNKENKTEETDDGVMSIDPNVSTVNIKAQDDLFTLGYDAD